MCQRAGQDGRPTAWWAQPFSAAARRPRIAVSVPAVSDTAVARHAADARPVFAIRSRQHAQLPGERLPVPGSARGPGRTRSAWATAHRISSHRSSSLRVPGGRLLVAMPSS